MLKKAKCQLDNKITVGELQFTTKHKSGDRYEGQMKNCKPHGSGTYTQANGHTFIGDFEESSKKGFGLMLFNTSVTCYSLLYDGEWDNNTMNGDGNMYWSDGSHYHGNWKNGSREGTGTLYYAHNDPSHLHKYEGNWKNDDRDGTGKLFWKNGDSFEGNFEKDKAMDGNATYTWSDGTKFEGEHLNGTAHGFGTLYFAAGDLLFGLKFEGDWENDARRGNGSFVYSNGTSVEGEWEDVQQKRVDEVYEVTAAGLRRQKDAQSYSDAGDKFTGHNGNITDGDCVRIRLSSGDIYEGRFVKGKKQGRGAFYFTDDYQYEGNFENDLKDGKGVYTWPDGARYIGHWEKGLRSGNGLQTFANGEKYQGEWKNGMIDGQGVFYKANGEKKQEGLFVNNTLWTGDGTFNLPSGDVYTGQWKDGKKHGFGAFVWKTGEKYVGSYSNDKKDGRGTFTWPEGRKYVGGFKDGNIEGFGTFFNRDGLIEKRGTTKGGRFYSL